MGLKEKPIMQDSKSHMQSVACLSPNSITLTLRQSPQLRTQIMEVRDTNHIANFHDLCRGLCRRLSPCIV